MKYTIELLSKNHNRKEFKCGKEMLDNYLHYQANQDVKRNLSVCFVLEDVETGLIKGYYTLANNSIPINSIPDKWRKNLPQSYSSIPATLLGRLAVDERFQGKGIGLILLFDALKRCYYLSKTIGSFAVVVDPLDKEAEKFYEKNGFIKLPGSDKMIFPIKELKELIKE